MYETEKRKISEWMTEVDRRRLVLPRFQRLEAWGSKDVEELLQSVIDELPIGSVLLLQIGEEPQFSTRPLEGAPEDGERRREMLLDGQQRMTALWRSLNNDYEDLEYFLKIDSEDPEEQEDLPIVRREKFYWRNGSKYPLWPNDPDKIHERGLVPFRILHPDAEDEATEWVREVVQGDQLAYQQRLGRYREIISNYEIPYIALKPETPPEAVITSFTKINTRGTPLSAFDLVVAQMEVHDVDLHEMTRRLRDQVPRISYFDKIDDLDLLRAVCLLDDRKPTKRRILRLDPDHLENSWDAIIRASQRAFGFLQQEGVLDSRRLPVKRIVPAMIALWTQVAEGGMDEGQARRLLRSYLWQGCVSNRYERGGMTPLIKDYRQMRDKIDQQDWSTPALDPKIAELPDLEELKEAGSPKKRARLARAILCLSLRQGAKDIHDGRMVTPENVQQREYHHLFPKSFLVEQDGDFDPERALNYSLVTWRTNRSISAKEPAKYLREATEMEGGRAELEQALRTHLVPPEPFFENDYEGFLEERARWIREGVDEVVKGNDWDP